MNEFQTIESGKAELKDAYPQALDAALKKRREKLYIDSGLGETGLSKEQKVVKGLIEPREG